MCCWQFWKIDKTPSNVVVNSFNRGSTDTRCFLHLFCAEHSYQYRLVKDEVINLYWMHFAQYDRFCIDSRYLIVLQHNSSLALYKIFDLLIKARLCNKRLKKKLTALTCNCTRFSTTDSLHCTHLHQLSALYNYFQYSYVKANCTYFVSVLLIGLGRIFLINAS